MVLSLYYYTPLYMNSYLEVWKCCAMYDNVFPSNIGIFVIKCDDQYSYTHGHILTEIQL